MIRETIKHLRFEPTRRIANTEVFEASKALARHLQDLERELGKRKRLRKVEDTRKFVRAVEAIAASLLVASLAGPDVAVATPLANGMMWGKNRYAHGVYGQPYRDALDLLKKASLITEVQRGYRHSAQASQPTLIKGTELLAQLLPIGRVKWSDFRLDADPECIILKSTKDRDGSAEVLGYEDTPTTKKLRNQVLRVNRWLAKASINLLPSNSNLDEEGYPIDPSRRVLRRTFNNGKWTEGGRLSGGFWMNMKTEERFARIRIDGETIANVDYGQLFLRLLYLKKQMSQPEHDLYNIRGDGSCRDGFKVLTNALLFSTGPLRGWPKECRKAFPKGTKLRDVVAEIKAFHPLICDQFEIGIGFRLLRMESDMLLRILENLYELGITALPLHDSVLVPTSRAEEARAEMLEVFKLFAGETYDTYPEASRGALVKITSMPN